jgi:hypothetical protein
MRVNKLLSENVWRYWFKSKNLVCLNTNRLRSIALRLQLPRLSTTSTHPILAAKPSNRSIDLQLEADLAVLVSCPIDLISSSSSQLNVLLSLRAGNQ